MNYTLTELLWLLIIYSFLGWTIETIVGTLKKKKFVNRGFSTGPFCLVYGIAAIIIALSLEELADSPLFLFLGSAALATLIEWITGKVLERLNRHKWWDYSGKKWNFDGYICLQYSIVWGILGSLTVKIGNRNLLFLFRLIPTFPRDLFVGVFTIAILLDLLASLAVIFHLKRQMPTAILWKKKIAVWTQRLGLAMVSHVERRIPKLTRLSLRPQIKSKKKGNSQRGVVFTNYSGFSSWDPSWAISPRQFFAASPQVHG
ncbi:MAG: putative ABC transporter permease [Blautia sp.]